MTPSSGKHFGHRLVHGNENKGITDHTWVITAEAKANSREEARNASKAVTMMAKQENVPETPAAAVPVVGNLAEEKPSHETTSHDVRYGFISKFVSDKSFGFIRYLDTPVKNLWLLLKRINKATTERQNVTA